MSTLLEEAQALFEYTQNLRRDFHRHPELGFQEKRTAGIIIQELSKTGIEVRSGIAQTGVSGYLEGQKSAPVLLLRFDMDALPIQEENETAYASTYQGIMHACGHDGHVAAGLTTSKLLKLHHAELPGSVQFVFQPAEEGLGGALQMIKSGILDDSKPNYCMAFHLWNERPVGWFSITPGPVMASSDGFTVHIRGRGGHGAIPNLTIDPVVVLGQLIPALQTIISRNVSPLDSAVLSIGQIRCGDAPNVIPNEAVVRGTIRTFSSHVRECILERLQNVCDGLALGYACEVELTTVRQTPAVINDTAMVQLVEKVVRENISGAVIEKEYRTMASEDFSFFLEETPGCMILVGSRNDEKGWNASHHHPKFNFDERALTNAATVLTATALRMTELA